MKRVIIITGPFGSGGATALRRLGNAGHTILDADELAHQVVVPGQPGHAQLVHRFGSDFLGKNGEIDRLRLNRACAQIL